MWPAMLCNRRFGGEEEDVVGGGVEFIGCKEECGVLSFLMEVCGDMISLYSFYRSYRYFAGL